MSEIDLATVKKQSVKGVVTLTSRTFLLQLINFTSMFLLTVFLAPEALGLFAVVSAAVNFLRYFSDIGLAAALIQKKGKLSAKDLKTTFTIQQTLVVLLVILGLLTSGKIAAWYHLSLDGLWLLRALMLSFFFSSLKTIPSVILERKLDFKRLMIPEIGETILFNLVAVALAFRGAGVASYTWAVLARGVSGLILIYLLVPWRPGLAFHRPSAKKLLSFGVPFQANSLLALAKDDLLTVFLGKALPLTEVGFIGWGQKWANLPLRFIMDNVNKVTFPAYSRLQDNLTALRTGIEKALLAVCFFTFPALIGLGLMASYLVELLPRYLKWQPALLSLYLFCIQAALACVSTTLTNVLNATGRIKTTLKLMMMWTGLTWVLTSSLLYFWNFNAVALAALLVSLTLIIPIIMVKKIVDFNLLDNVGKPLISALLMAGCLFYLLPVLGRSLPGLGMAVIFGAIIYLTVMFFLMRKKLLEAVNLVLGTIKK